MQRPEPRIWNINIPSAQSLGGSIVDREGERKGKKLYQSAKFSPRNRAIYQIYPLPLSSCQTHPGKYHAPVICRSMLHNPKPTDQARNDKDRSWYEGRSGDDEHRPAPSMEFILNGLHSTAAAQTPSP